MQGNDHTLAEADVHHAARQCSDCGAFYMGWEWTYRGNSILDSRFSELSSVWGGSPPSTSTTSSAPCTSTAAPSTTTTA